MPSKPAVLAILDIVTDPWKYGRAPTPFLFTLYDGQRHRVFDTAATLADFLRKTPLLVASHYGGLQDFYHLVPFLEPSALRIIEGAIVKGKIGKSTIIDSSLVLRTAEKYQTVSTPVAWKYEEGHREKYREEIESHSREHCETLYDRLSEIYQTYGRKLTLAGVAMHEWKKRGGKPTHTNKRFYDLFKPFFFGGRVENRMIGVREGTFTLADINSAYAFAMLHPHPMPKASQVIHTRHFPPDRYLQGSFLVVECESNGFLPYRTESGMVNYTKKRRHFHCTGWEWLAALECGAITGKVYLQEAWYTKSEPVSFRTFVDDFYRLKGEGKAEGNAVKSAIGKGVLVGLYGKFAANPEKYRNYIIGEWGRQAALEYGEQGWSKDTMLSNRQVYSKPIPASHRGYYNLATAASITGCARAILSRQLFALPSWYYCDTDSVIADSAALVDLHFSALCGDWKEVLTGNRLAIVGKKVYSLVNEHSLRNLPKPSTKEQMASVCKTAVPGGRLEWYQIEALAKGNPQSWQSAATENPLRHGAPGYISRIYQPPCGPSGATTTDRGEE